MHYSTNRIQIKILENLAPEQVIKGLMPSTLIVSPVQRIPSLKGRKASEGIFHLSVSVIGVVQKRSDNDNNTLDFHSALEFSKCSHVFYLVCKLRTMTSILQVKTLRPTEFKWSPNVTQLINNKKYTQKNSIPSEQLFACSSSMSKLTYEALH